MGGECEEEEEEEAVSGNNEEGAGKGAQDKVAWPVVYLIKKKSHNPLMGATVSSKKNVGHRKRIEESAPAPWISRGYEQASVFNSVIRIYAPTG